MADFTYEIDLPPGIVSDDTTFGSKGRWADGSNMRFHNGRPEKIGRVIRILGTGGGGTVTVATTPRTIFAYSSSALSVPPIVVGTDAVLYSSGGLATGLTDVTPVGLGTGLIYWAFDSWGDLLLAAPKGGTLYQQSGVSVATEITQAPDQMNHMVVTAQRQVMALGCNEEISTTFNPMCIRWCDLENFTNWTSSATNNAGEYILEGQGKIVAGRRVGDGIAIWTSGMLYYATFVGDPSKTYDFRPVSDGCGLIGPGGVTELGGVAYWMSPDHSFNSWAPGGPVVKLPCPISIELQTNMNAGSGRLDARTVAVKQPAFNEVWFFYPDLRDVATGGYRYVAFNVADGSWFRGVLDRRSAYYADFLYNPASSVTTRGWRPFISIDGDGKIYSHEVETFGGAGDGEDVFSSFIQSADQYLNSGGQRVMVTGAVPDFETQTATISLTLYMRNRPQSTAVTKGPYSLATSDNKKDFRASGMIMSAKFSSAGASTERWRLGKPILHCTTQGGR